jgi:hypothetical protein
MKSLTLWTLQPLQKRKRKLIYMREEGGGREGEGIFIFKSIKYLKIILLLNLFKYYKLI